MERLACPSGYEVPAECSQTLQPNTVGKFTKCGHTFHMPCMLAMYNNGTKVCTILSALLTVNCIQLFNMYFRVITRMDDRNCNTPKNVGLKKKIFSEFLFFG